MVKNPPSNAGDIQDAGSIPGSGRSSAGGHGNPLQYSCLENSMDRRNWRATVHRISQESDTTEAGNAMFFMGGLFQEHREFNVRKYMIINYYNI